MQRRTKKVARALSLKARRKTSLSDVIPLPKPQFEFEDTLVTQLRASDVLANCYEEYDGDITITINRDSPKKQTILHHPCYHDNNLFPVWQAFSNLDRKSTGAVLLGRIMSLSSMVGPVLNGRYLTEKTVHEQFINTTHVSFVQFKVFIEKCVARNPLSFAIEWEKLRSACWRQCQSWHLNPPPCEVPNDEIPPELHHSFYWLWCVFNQIAEPDTYPPSADNEEIELILRKLCSSIGILWEDSDDNVSSVSSSSLSSNPHEHNGVNNNGLKAYDGSSMRASTIRRNSYVRIVEEELPNDPDDCIVATETLLVTFHQFLSIVAETMGSETILSPAFGRAVKQVYLTEVEEVIRTGWISMKKPGTDVWKRRWGVLKKHNIEFYSDPICDLLKYQITLNNKMHVESLPDASSHKHRFRLVEREGDFNIAWEAEMSCSDSQHSHSWMLCMNLTIKIQQTGLTAKRIEIAERRLERHRRRESELNAIEKKREVKRTRKRLQEVRERWNLMQTKLNERALARDKAMETMQKMDEIYDRLQALTKKQSLIRKANARIRNAFPSMSSDSGVDVMNKEEKTLIESRDEKLTEYQDKMKKIEDEKQILQEQLLELQASAILSKDSEKTLILVYGPERQAAFVQEEQLRQRSASVAALKPPSGNSHRRSNSPFRKNTIPAISISTSALTNSPSSSPVSSSACLITEFSQSHPELSNGDGISRNKGLRSQTTKQKKTSFDSDMSNLSGERLV
ncbi:uncharacterized protein LOC120345910 isoform X1 [Styela clava]